MAATRVLVQLPPTYSEEVPVKWYGAPSAAEIETACRAAIGAKLQSLDESDPLVLVDEDGDTVVLSHTLPSGLKLRLQLPETPTAREGPSSGKKSKKEKKAKKEKKEKKERKSETADTEAPVPQPDPSPQLRAAPERAAAPPQSAWSRIGQSAGATHAAPSAPTQGGGKRRRRERRDWACSKCGTLCFEKKTACFKCGAAKPA